MGFISLLLAGLTISSVSGHECQYDVIQQQVADQLQIKQISVAATGKAAFAPIRIVMNTDQVVEGTGGYTVDQMSWMINEILPEAKAWLENSILVQPLVATITASGTCYQATLSDTANADYALFVTNTDQPTAAATSCLVLSGTYQPIAGNINVPASYVTVDPAERRFLVDVVIHELVHALGFSVNFFDHYSGGSPVQVYAESGKTKSAITSPLVVSFVQDYFSCNTLIGAELEDQGGSGTAGSHWEARIYKYELMAGSLNKTTGAKRSALTLALLASTGWYQVNYTYTEDLLWGAGLGCDFAQGTCDQWPADYFCIEYGLQSCSLDKRFRAGCNLIDFGTAIEPFYFRYFTDDSSDYSLGGMGVIDDYCPTYTPFSDGDCWNTDNTARSVLGETLGASSRCYTGSLIASGNPVAYNARCYPTYCTNGQMQIEIGGVLVSCPFEGGSLTHAGYDGYLECPSYESVCGVACGDGVIDTSEICDDGNTDNDDGCSNLCLVEDGFECNGQPSACIIIDLDDGPQGDPDIQGDNDAGDYDDTDQMIGGDSYHGDNDDITDQDDTDQDGTDESSGDLDVQPTDQQVSGDSLGSVGDSDGDVQDGCSCQTTTVMSVWWQIILLGGWFVRRRLGFFLA